MGKGGSSHGKQKVTGKQIYELASSGKASELRLLLEKACTAESLNWANPSKSLYTPLIIAAYNGYIEVVKILLEQCDMIDVNKCNKHEATALHWAAGIGRLEICKMLISHPNINFNLLDNDKRTPLNRAACNGRVEVVRLLLEQEPAIYKSVNAADLDGSTPCHHACRNGHIEVLRLLLASPIINTSVEMVTNENRTPLLECSHSGKLDCLELMIKKGANLNVRDREGRSVFEDVSRRIYDKAKLEQLQVLLRKYSMRHDTWLRRGSLMLFQETSGLLYMGNAHKTQCSSSSFDSSFASSSSSSSSHSNGLPPLTHTLSPSSTSTSLSASASTSFDPPSITTLTTPEGKERRKDEDPITTIFSTPRLYKRVYRFL